MDQITEFIDDNRLKLTIYKIPCRTDQDPTVADSWGTKARHFHATIYRPVDFWDHSKGVRAISIEYSQGPAHKKFPTLAEILYSLRMDVQGHEEGGSVDSWIDDMGWEIDSVASFRAASKVYEACMLSRKKMIYLLGTEAFEQWLEIEEE